MYLSSCRISSFSQCSDWEDTMWISCASYRCIGWTSQGCHPKPITEYQWKWLTINVVKEAKQRSHITVSGPSCLRHGKVKLTLFLQHLSIQKKLFYFLSILCPRGRRSHLQATTPAPLTHLICCSYTLNYTWSHFRFISFWSRVEAVRWFRRG